MVDMFNSKDRILRTAARLFQLKGYHATGLNEILKESRSPKGSLYYYFPNGKEELALEAINLINDSIKRTIKERISRYSDPIKAFQLLIKEIANDLHENEKLEGISVSLLSLETYLTHESLRKACASAFQSWENIYVEKMMECGFSEERSKQLATVIQLMIDGAIVMSLAKKDCTPLLLVAEQIPDLLKH